ncbi:hypothetical protein E4665_07940 [Sporolactobacillus shoreae]|uniref:CPBP family intramembrane metalloprotease n=1 Tax=Sporolactobacillus shoreae TaxID=1465501 RepID=A0A4Z0GPX2_9BACL|nr:hypothetical protein [Sporolactobacillus shoreae]TGA98449.1 hypothetical protein E4665_07940 [Sporolactobacillus shoreae]
MASIFELEVNKNAESAYKEKKYSLPLIISMSFTRIFLFLLFQFIFFIVFKMSNVQSPWQQSTYWWPFVVTIANVICVILLNMLLKRENKRYWNFFVFDKKTVLKDSFMSLGLLLLCIPVANIPFILLGNALFGDYMGAVNLFIRPLPIWAAWTAFMIFPLTMLFGELTTYFGYVMPRLEIITRNKWFSLFLPAIMLSFQHAALPLIFDPRFIVWRLFMFLPFAIVIGFVVRWKPKLLPYFLIGHFLLDLTTAFQILSVSIAK